MMKRSTVTARRRGVRLFAIQSDPATKKALSVLRDAGVEADVVGCPPSFSEWYPCPLLRDDSGSTFCGIDGVHYYVNSLCLG